MTKWFSKKKTAAGSAVLMLALPLVAQYEGLRTKAYLDPIGIKTVCYGETQSDIDRSYTKEECEKMLTIRLGYFATRVDGLVIPEISPQEMAAYSSLAYNVGLAAFEKSTILRLLNNGNRKGACNELLRWNKAGSKVLPGLVKRREAERALCLSGL